MLATTADTDERIGGLESALLTWYSWLAKAVEGERGALAFRARC